MTSPGSQIDFELYERYHHGAQPLRQLPTRQSYTYARILQTLEQTLNGRSKLKILDYGCGVGTIGLYLAQQGHQVLGVDISPTSIRAAQQAAKNFGLTKQASFKTFRSTRALFGSLKSNNFDLVICSEVIEHITNDLQLLRDLKQVAKPNGQLLLTTRSTASLPLKLGWLAQHEQRAGHLRRYSDQTLTKLCQASGWRLLSLQRVDSLVREIIYGFPVAGQLVRVLKGPLATIALWLESPLISCFGYGGYILVLQKRSLIAKSSRSARA